MLDAECPAVNFQSKTGSYFLPKTVAPYEQGNRFVSFDPHRKKQVSETDKYDIIRIF